jgi:hypothetical protein
MLLFMLQPVRKFTTHDLVVRSRCRAVLLPLLSTQWMGLAWHTQYMATITGSANYVIARALLPKLSRLFAERELSAASRRTLSSTSYAGTTLWVEHTMSKLMVYQTTSRLFYLFFRCIVDITDFSVGDHLFLLFRNHSGRATPEDRIKSLPSSSSYGQYPSATSWTLCPYGVVK